MSQPELPSGRNRRRAPRRPARSGTKAICRKGTLGLGPNLAVALLDVSETGVRLSVREALPAGQEVEVGLLAPGCTREHRLCGRVVWLVPAEGGMFFAGVQFDRQLSYAALQDLGRLPGA